MDENIQIMMLGPRRVGKTTALALMQKHFNDQQLANNIRLTPINPGAIDTLGDKITQIEELYGKDILELPNTPGSTEAGEYMFLLERLSRVTGANIEFRFYDYPGGWIRGDDPNHNTLVENVENSMVYMVIIDAAALMEENGIYNSRLNNPSMVNELLIQALAHVNNGKERRLVLLVPVKCESYVANPDRKVQTEFIAKIHDKYNSIIHIARQNPNFTIAITPIQTLGTGRFSEIVGEGDQVNFVFKKTSPTAIHAPVNVEQPLYYAMNFIMNYHSQVLAPEVWGRFGWLRRRLARMLDRDLKDAAQDIARKMKVKEPFQIISGRKHLGLPESE